MNAYRFEILGAPVSANTIWRYRKGRDRPYLSAEARAFRRRVKTAAKEAGITEPLAGDVSIDIRYFYGFIDHRIDLDNTLKATLDALQTIVINDDAQVRRLTAERDHDPRRPRLEIAVSLIGPNTPSLWEPEI